MRQHESILSLSLLIKSGYIIVADLKLILTSQLFILELLELSIVKLYGPTPFRNQ